MCGIAGYIQTQPPPGDTIARMVARMNHRGPDGSGLWTGTCNGWSIALGHSRLAIIDPSGGHQPMRNENGQLHISFNNGLRSIPGHASRCASPADHARPSLPNNLGYRSCHSSSGRRRKRYRSGFGDSGWHVCSGSRGTRSQGNGSCSPATAPGSSRSTTRCCPTEESSLPPS